MSSPQIEDGYTRIANEILENICSRKFNGTQFRLIIAIWRYTYGFQRKEHDISVTFLSRATGIHKDVVKRELNKLIESGVILVVQEPSFKSTRRIAFNKIYEDWQIEQSGQVSNQGTKKSPPDEKAPPQGTKKSPPPGDQLAPQEINIFKDKSKENIYSDQFDEFWTLYPKKVGKAKAREKFLKLAPKFDFERVMQGTRKYISYCEEHKRFLKDGATFVNQQAWDDFVDLQTTETIPNHETDYSEEIRPPFWGSD